MKFKPYNSISCQLHSELELIIMHKKCIQAELEQGKCIIKPYDLVTEKHSGEFLLAIDENGLEIKIRLDQIKSWNILD